MRVWPLFALAAAVRPAAAQDARAYVTWSAEPAAVGADGTALVRLTGIVSPGWKMYAATSPPPAPALRVSLDSTSGRLVGPVRHVDAPEAAFDSLLGVPVEQVTRRARLDLPVRVSAGPDLPVSVRFAVCDASICLAPRTVVVPVALQREADVPSRSSEAPAPTDENPSPGTTPVPQVRADTLAAVRSVAPESAAAPVVAPEADSLAGPSEARPDSPAEERRWAVGLWLATLAAVLGIGFWVAQRR